MLKITKLNMSVRAIVSMLISLVLVAANVSNASAVGSTAQTISFTAIANQTYGAADLTPTVVANPGGRAVDLTASGACSIVAGKVHLDGAGTCTVNADQAGDATYAAASRVTKTFTVSPKSITVTPTTSATSIWSNEAFPTISYTMAAGQLVGNDAMSGVVYNYNNGTTSTSTTPTAPGYYNITATPVLTTGSISNYNVTGTVGVCVKDAARRSADGGIMCFSTPADLTGIGTLDMGWDRASNKFTDWVTPGQTKTALTNQSSGSAQYKGGYLPAVTLVSLTAYYVRPNDGPGNCVSKVAGMGSTTMQIGNGGAGSASINNGTTGWATSNNGGFGGYTGATGTALAINVTYSKPAGNSTYPVGWVVECYAGASGWSSASFSAVQVRPIISSISTNNGYVAGGTSLTISGSSFSTGSPAATVTVGGVPCVISAQTVTSITCTTGAGTAGLADVVVTNADGVTGTKAAAFTYAVPATVVPSNSVAPTITSAGVITTPGSTLVANIGTWDTQGDAFTTTGYQWQICTTILVATCVDVAGATGQNWASTAAAANRYVRVGVTITNDAGATTVYSALTALLDKTNQTITFNNFANAAYGDADVTPVATSSAGGLVTYSIDPSSTATCSIVAGKVHFTAVGTCVVNANSVATDQINAANQVQKTLTITKKALTLTPAIAKNSFWTTDTFPALSFTASGLATGETISAVTYSFNNGTSTVTSTPTTPGYYTLTAGTPVFGTGSADNYTVTSANASFCLNDGAQKNASGLAVCFSSPWVGTEVNNLSYGWDAATGKYTTWVRAGQTPTTLTNQSSKALQFEGTANMETANGIASGYYTPAVNETYSCSINFANVQGTFTANFANASLNLSGSGPGSSSSASASGNLTAGVTYAINSTYNITANHTVPLAWYFPCSVGGRPMGQLPLANLSSVIRPVITSITPASGLVAGGNTIVIAGANLGGVGSTVKIGNNTCNVASTPAPTATSITCTVPAGTEGMTDVTVTTSTGTAGTKVGGYSYEAASYPVPTNSVTPVISTSAASPYAVASSIASTTGTWNMNGDPTTTTTIAWEVCATAQALICTPIANAAGTPWSSTADVAGKYLRSVVTATNNGGSTTAASNIIGPFAKAAQSMVIATISNKSVGIADFFPAITYTPATPVRVATLGSTTPLVCTIVDNKIHIIANGTCSITADLPEDGTFAAAVQKTASFSVVAPVFTSAAATDPAWFTDYSYQYVFTNPSAVFTLKSGTLPEGITLSATGLLTGKTSTKPGESFTFEVSATDASGTTTISDTIVVVKSRAVIVGGGFLEYVTVGGQMYLSTVNLDFNDKVPPRTNGQEVGWMYFESTSPDFCSVTRGGLVKILKKGACTTHLVPDTNFGADWTRTLNIGALGTYISGGEPKPGKPNSITFQAPTNQVSSAADFALNVKATSGTAPTVTSSTPSVCTVAGLTVHIVGVGTCTISASGAGTETFAEAPAVAKSFEVVSGPDRPTITAATSVGAAGGTALVTFTNGDLKGWTPTGYQVTATPASGSFGFPATVTCPTVGVACVVTGLTPGVEYTFVASTLASSGTLTAKVDSLPSSPVLAKLPQEIAIVSPGVKRPDAGSFPLFPVSDIGSVVTPDVASVTPLVCTVDSNNVVTIVGPGTCSLSVTSPGVTARGIAYGDAAPVTLTFPVSTTVPAVTTATPLASATVGVAVNIVNTAVAGSATAPIPTTVAGTWTAAGLPAGLVIDSKSGKITGTPTAPGVYNQILVSVKDKAGVVASKPLSLTVLAGPGIVGPSTIAVVAGQPVTVRDLAALPGSSAIPTTGAWAVTSGTLPAGLTLNPDTGVVSGTPTGLVGKVTVTISLTDSAPLTSSKVLTFDVAAAPVFGVAGGANPAATVNLIGVAKVPGLKLASGSAFSAPAVVPGTAGKPAKGAYTAVPTGSSTALPDGIVFNPDTGAITGTPLVPGTYDFKVVFTDAKGLTAEQPYRFVVATPPTITNAVMLPVYTVPATGTAPVFSVDLEGEQGTNSIPGTAAWSVVAPTALPAGLTLNADTGVISGTPPTGLTKDYTFKIRLVDALGLTAEKTFTLPVIKAGVNKTTLNLPAEIASGTLFTDKLYDLNGDSTATPALLPAGASSMNLAVTYSVTATSVMSCFVDADNMLHIIGAGVCGVTATSGTAAAKNVSVATQTFVVSKRSQVLTVTAPGETVPGSNPAAVAPAATDDPAGFRIAASLTSGLDPVYTVVPAKNPDGTDREPNCAVDETGNVTWLYDMTLTSTSPGYDLNGDKCRVAISHPGDNNYGSVVTQFLDLDATHVDAPAQNDDSTVEPGVSMGLPRTGGTAYKSGVGFTVKVTPSGVTVQPISKGLYIGPITANITVEYKKGNVTQTQSCTTSFGIALRDSKKNVITNPALETKAAIAAITAPYRAMPKGGPKGYLAGKTFTNSVTCVLGKDAVDFFKAGGQLKANAEVIRDRRWPTTYKAAKPNGEKIAPRTVNWVLKVG